MTKVPSSRLDRSAPPSKGSRSEPAVPPAEAPNTHGTRRSRGSEGEGKLHDVGDGLLQAIGDTDAEVTQPEGMVRPPEVSKKDAFERANAVQLARLQQMRDRREPPIKTRAQPGTALAALNEAQPQGVYFQEDENPHQTAAEDPELDAAVEEAIRLLFGVPGIHHIGPGMNDSGERVVVIACARGFSESSLAKIPDTVHRFKTLLAVPYELLPLRRT